MLTVLNSDTIDVIGTCLQGYITATQTDLEKVFGQITYNGSADGKTTKEWNLLFTNEEETEIVATIYDWKTGGVNETEIHQWHIGGYNRETANYVNQYFNQIRQKEIQCQ